MGLKTTKQQTQPEVSNLLENEMLRAECEGLRRRISELETYKQKYEKLQRDVQNNVINASTDSKQILIEFKEQNERQIEVIEALKLEIEHISKQNQVYRTFNNTGSQANNQVLQSMLDKSDKEYTTLKNIQLKKLEQVSKSEEAKIP